jgi:rhomboid-like protein
VSILGKEQFAALYLSAGVISSFASSLYKVATSRIGYSLGASGALFTMIGVYGTLLPDSKLQV